jgi:hypothetical protein
MPVRILINRVVNRDIAASIARIEGHPCVGLPVQREECSRVQDWHG